MQRLELAGLDTRDVKLGEDNERKLKMLDNQKVTNIVKMAVLLCKPETVSVITDDPADIAYVRELALKNGEETKLATAGHTIHFDGYYDQARDKLHTRFLLPEGLDLGPGINSINREEGLNEIATFFAGSMQGKTMLVRFFSLGPTGSDFSIPAMQITDSAYVAHSEDLLYRTGYEEFKKLEGSGDFFYFIHSAGRLENGVTADVDKRRIYIDLVENRVFSVNNQYAGNSLGLKKLAFRLAIRRASKQGWLAEHMFIMGAKGPKGRTTYFSGAFPSGCGKTSTAMLEGQTIIGDDIAYIRNIDGAACAANVESGIFGIIRDVNPKDDPVIYDALTSPGEVIFSNVLINDSRPYWLGMGMELPAEGVNHSGKWYKGKRDKDGNEITASHKNSRYTIRLNNLKNVDSKVNDPAGVLLSGIVYGGRDSDTTVPVAESLSWAHGVFSGASLESETTFATIGKEGERKINPMANLDFLSVPLGTYITSHLKFGAALKNPPKIFCVNYFLKDRGKYLNGMMDKQVWLAWMEGRIHGDLDALLTPVGYIPKYDDLKQLFSRILGKDYTPEEYELQFTIRVGKYLEKLDRIKAFYDKAGEMPKEFWRELQKQRERLQAVQKQYGKDMIPPGEFQEK